MASALIAVAAVWLAVSVRMYRHFADMAVAELERSGHDAGRQPTTSGTGPGTSADIADLDPLADPRTIARLRAALTEPARQELAIELMSRVARAPTVGVDRAVDIRAELAIRCRPQ